jgi:hypothetical protein
MIILYGKGRYGTPRFGTARNVEIGDSSLNGFDLLAEMLYQHALEPIHPDLKDDHWWFNSVVLKPDAQGRTGDDVAGLEPFFNLDMDKPGWSMARLAAIFPPLRMIVHTTTSSTTDWPRMRLVMAVDRPYTAREYPSLWRWANEMTGGSLDPNTKDATRISYMPARWLGAYNDFQYYPGDFAMSVDVILKSYPIEAPKPPPPFVPLNAAPHVAKIITDAMIANHVGNQSGRMFKILCAAATHHKVQGWTLTADDLCAEAITVAGQIGHRDSDANLRRECQRAIDYIADKVATKSRIEQARERLQFEQDQKSLRRERLLDK